MYTRDQPTAQYEMRQHQRFSWQAQQDEELSHDSATQQRAGESVQPPSVNTSVPPQRQFSYVQTPAEHLAFPYTTSVDDPPVPQTRPMSYTTTHFAPVDPHPQSTLTVAQGFPLQTIPSQSPPAYWQDERNISPTAIYQSGAQAIPSPVSPVMPMAPPQSMGMEALTSQSRHTRQRSNLSPINTDIQTYPMPPMPSTPPSGSQASPMPNKTLLTPISASSTKADHRRSGPTTPSNRKSFANEPYSPHGFSSGQTNNVHAIFSPDAAHGPNGFDFALHQPGQIAHPNMESNNSPQWMHSLCACNPDVATCVTGLFCPCVLYGRTAHRLSQKSAKNDPTNLLGHSSLNGHCMLMSLACGLWWLFPMLQRTRIRHIYKIQGSLGNDLLKGCCCCCCCVAVQNEREVKGREEESRRWAGPASTAAYSQVTSMVYKPQH